MRKSVLFLILFGLTVSGSAQYYWDYGFKLGVTNSLTDMGGKEQPRRDFIMDMKLSQSRWAMGGFVRYKLNDYVSIAAALEYGRLQGSDQLSTNKGRVGRNLSFRNDIFELNTRGELYVWNLYDVGNRGRYRMDMKTFVFAGLGAALSNPKAKNTDYSFKYQSLRPLMTEGKKYSLIQAVFPVGFGVCFTYKKQYRFGFEFGWRLSFTDYLDDVSKVYPDPANYDPAIYSAFINRTDEVENMDDAWAANYLPGSKRGDPSHNDNYMFMQLTYSYVLRTQGAFYRTKYGYLGGRSKGFSRVRAKF
jgi:hypothetical protein